MHLFITKHHYTKLHNYIKWVIFRGFLTAKVFTITALVAPVSSIDGATFSANELDELQETICFHIEAKKIPKDIRCSCLHGGRFCLTARHWVIEYDMTSSLWLGRDGQPRVGSLIHYDGVRKGGRSATVGAYREIIFCVEGVGVGKDGHVDR
jgi:hypothetical protein